MQPLASQIYGLYTGLVYLTPLFGGLIADQWLGQRRTVIIGATLMAAGHFMMAFEPLFLLALTTLIVANGAFKPNIVTQVGGLYEPGDPRRDRAYSIFYVGINVGAFLAPLVCGTLGEGLGWHYGFLAAGVGMTLSLAIYLYALPTLPPDEMHRLKAAGLDRQPLDSVAEWRAIMALAVLFVPTTLFFATYEQQGNTIALWADDYTDRVIDLVVWHGEIPVTWFQAFNPLMIFAFTPLIVGLWSRQARRGREPSTITKMALGCFAVAFSYLIMVGGRVGRAGRRSELVVAIGLLRRPHRRRALSFADQPFAGLEGGARPSALDDDGPLAGDELHRQSPLRLARQLLERHGQDELLLDARGPGRCCRRRHPRLQAAAQGHPGRVRRLNPAPRRGRR